MAIDGLEIVLDISGLGIIFYSPPSVRHIAKGSDYYSSNYSNEEQVQPHIQAGSLVGFGTGTPGTFLLKFHSGYPDHEQNYDFSYRLGLVCSEGVVCFRDLYDLLEWEPECPQSQKIELEDGFYHVTLGSDSPESGVLGENQTIDIYLQKLGYFPALSERGMPALC